MHCLDGLCCVLNHVCRTLCKSSANKHCISDTYPRNTTTVFNETPTLQVSSASQASTHREANAALRELAQLLHASPAESAPAQLEAIFTELERLLSQLPPTYFEPLIPEASLNPAQVGSLGVCWVANCFLDAVMPCTKHLAPKSSASFLI